MAIYDWNGTTSTENKKAYDWNGTTSTKNKKAYDWDGTASHLIYTAETPLVENSKGNYSFVKAYSTNYSDTVHSNKNGATIIGRDGDMGMTHYYIDFNVKGFKTLSIAGTTISNNAAGYRDRIEIAIGTKTNIAKFSANADGWGNSMNVIKTINNSEINQTYSFSASNVDISAYTGSDVYIAFRIMGYYKSTNTLNISSLIIAD